MAGRILSSRFWCGKILNTLSILIESELFLPKGSTCWRRCGSRSGDNNGHTARVVAVSNSCTSTNLLKLYRINLHNCIWIICDRQTTISRIHSVCLCITIQTIIKWLNHKIRLVPIKAWQPLIYEICAVVGQVSQHVSILGQGTHIYYLKLISQSTNNSRCFKSLCL